MAKTQIRHALEIDGTRLTLAQLREFDASRPFVQLAGAARERMQLSVAAVDRLAAAEARTPSRIESRPSEAPTVSSCR